ncbi:MAG: hypothetical protein HIU82_06240 [Proteobacteria bacterium]|nr:hypothetical protein [Pseudomonadota bacterium]
MLEPGEPRAAERINVTSTKPTGYQLMVAIPAITDALARLTWGDPILYDAACRRPDAAPSPDASSLHATLNLDAVCDGPSRTPASGSVGHLALQTN